MALRSGLDAQLGFAEESAAGTFTAPTDFLPLVTESMGKRQTRVESDAIIAGERVLTENMWNGGNIEVGGDLGLQLYNRGLTLLFEHMFGGVSVSGASAPYTYEYVPGDLDGKALTVQLGRPSVSGTVQPFSYTGCKVLSWEIACAVGEIATLGLTLAGMDEDTSKSLASVGMPAGIKPFKFNHASVKIGGTAAKVKGLTLSGDNGLDDDRRFLGGQTIDEPLEAAIRTYEGSLEMEFVDLTQYNRFIAGTTAKVGFSLVSGADEIIVEYNARFDGETPNIGGPEILTQNLPIKAVKPSGGDAVKATIITSEAPSGS